MSLIILIDSQSPQWYSVPSHGLEFSRAARQWETTTLTTGIIITPAPARIGL